MRRRAFIALVVLAVMAAVGYLTLDSIRNTGPVTLRYEYDPGLVIESEVDAEIRMARYHGESQLLHNYKEKMTYRTWCGSAGVVCRERWTTSISLLAREKDGKPDFTPEARNAFDSNSPMPSFEFLRLDRRGIDSGKGNLGTGIYDLVRAAFDVRILPEGEVSPGDTHAWEKVYGDIGVSLRGEFLGGALGCMDESVRLRNRLELFRPLETGKRDRIGTVEATLLFDAEGKLAKVSGMFDFHTVDSSGRDVSYHEEFVETYRSRRKVDAEKLDREIAFLEKVDKFLRGEDRKLAAPALEAYIDNEEFSFFREGVSTILQEVKTD